MRKTLAALAGTAILLGGASRAYASPSSGYSSMPSYTSVAVVDPASLFFLAAAGVTAIAKLGKHFFPGRGRIPSDEEVDRNRDKYPGAIDVTPWDQGPKFTLKLGEEEHERSGRREMQDEIEQMREELARKHGTFYIKPPQNETERMMREHDSLKWQLDNTKDDD